MSETTKPKRSFRTRDGRTYVVDVNVLTRRRCMQVSGVDVYETARKGIKALGELVSDLERFLDCVYGLTKDQVDAAGLTLDQFLTEFDGEALNDAAEATVEAIIDFFPDRAVRESLRRAIKTALETFDAGKTLTVEALDKVTPEAVVRVLTSTS